MTPEQILTMWGIWSRRGTGKPQGLPKESPMFKGRAKFTDAEWGPEQSAPEPADPPILESVCEKAQAVIHTMDRLDQALLANAFVARAVSWRRMTLEQYSAAVAEAVKEFGERFHAYTKAPMTKKSQVITLLETTNWKTRYVARAVGVSTSLVRRIKREISV